MATIADTTSGAAYLVPGQYAATIFDAALQMEVVRPRAAIYPMTTECLTIAGVSHGDGTTGAFGVKPRMGQRWRTDSPARSPRSGRSC